MATNSNTLNSSKMKLFFKGKLDKNKTKKKSKNILYSALKSGITDHFSSEEEEEKENPIKIYYKEKMATIYMNINEPFSKFINIIKEKFRIENFEKKFEIFYNHKEIPLTDGRLMIEIISNEEEKEEDVIFELREKSIKNMGYKDKLYIELENVPSFMDLTMQITYFINTQKKEVDYELNYSNNIYKLLFSSNQIGFSFVSFMTNLKFTNKYYRKLKIDIHYNTIEKLRYENDKEIDKEKERYIKPKMNILHSPYLPNKGLNLLYKPKQKKSKSYGNIFNNNYFSNDEYNVNKINFINNCIPYEQEKLMRRIEKAKNRKKWMNLKGFFTSANLQSFNRLISPNKKIHKIKINNNEKKSKVFFLNNIND